ncbi:MAG: hypothetical protein COW54_02025 [Rhodobacteraceae bacterium CG17_big_fil_post_rev_8_21_14_2_50_63_15]|nr:hypothetical protein [Roseovarius sp.]PIV79844.1 MAG: hypothetical protein COW54_02025 [Rhodobacteraceae bacterium CG17_big_fil_post_rev_8_21_14_2_50_63_15]
MIDLSRICRRAGLVLVVIGVMAGCTERKERVLFDGVYYPPKSRAEKQDQRNFTASVSRANRGIEGAQKAAVHEATRYCLENFGTSEIDWRGVPEGSEGPLFARSGDRVSVSGRCAIWR